MKVNGKIDEHGVPYSNDILCHESLVKHHSDGIKNIYNVRVVYERPNGTDKIIRMSYGDFPTARMRFDSEMTARLHPSKLVWKCVMLSVATYDGTKKIFEDELLYTYTDEKESGE